MSEKSNPENFEKLLRWLGSDRDAAAEVYERLRRGLILFFFQRGCANAEDLTDLVFDRVTEKQNWLAANYRGVPEKYFYGVAKMILLESFREKKMLTENNVLDNYVIDAGAGEDEQSLVCLRKCLATLDEKNSRLILEYYDTENLRAKNYHESLAAKYARSVNGLRTHVFRLKNQLARCVKNCLNRN